MALRVRVSEPLPELQPRLVVRGQSVDDVPTAEVRSLPTGPVCCGGRAGGDAAPPRAAVQDIPMSPAPRVKACCLSEPAVKTPEIGLCARPRIGRVPCARDRPAARVVEQTSPVVAAPTGSIVCGPPEVRISAGMSVMARLPHVRKPVWPERLDERDAVAFARETEAARGLGHETCRLVAVYRNVPIELVARMRMEPKSGALVFSLTPCGGRPRTRVYDLARVTELRTGTEHLSAHRTRYRTVFLT